MFDTYTCLAQGMDVDTDVLTPEEEATLKAIRGRKAQIVAAHRRTKSAADNHSRLPRRANAENKTGDNMKVSSSAGCRR